MLYGNLILHIKFYKIPYNKSKDTIITRVKKKKTDYQCTLLSCVYLKCIIVISNNMYLAYKILGYFIQQKPNLYYSKNSIKIVATTPHKKLCSKNYINVPF